MEMKDVFQSLLHGGRPFLVTTAAQHMAGSPDQDVEVIGSSVARPRDCGGWLAASPSSFWQRPCGRRCVPRSGCGCSHWVGLCCCEPHHGSLALDRGLKYTRVLPGRLLWLRPPVLRWKAIETFLVGLVVDLRRIVGWRQQHSSKSFTKHSVEMISEQVLVLIKISCAFDVQTTSCSSCSETSKSCAPKGKPDPAQ